MFIDWFSKGFELGCGISFTDALGSERFSQLHDMFMTSEEKYQKDTDEGVALRAGHLDIGTFLNTLDESVAITKASEFAGCVNTSILKQRAMIQLFGESLVHSAGECLTNEMIQMAETWQTKSPEEQIEMLRWLYLTLRGSNQGELGQAMSTESAYLQIAEKLEDRTGPESYLPKLYGKWDKDNCPAECQGKSQMITAFARLAGAEVVLACPVTDINRVVTRWRMLASELVAKDIFERNLTLSDEFRDSLMASPIYNHTRMMDTSFHVGCVIRLSDGRWVVVDPHSMTFGLMPEDWSMSEIYSRLEKYRLVAPGLHLLGDDKGRSDQILSSRMETVSDLIRRSKVMEDKINTEVENFSDFVDLLTESDDFDLLLRLMYEEECLVLDPEVITNPETKKYAVIQLLTKGDISLGRLFDPKLLTSSISEWLTLYHALAAGIFLNQSQEAGEVIHPAMEFALPEYNIAMAALNSLAIDFHKEDDDYRFFPDNSFCQMHLHNCLLRRQLAKAAAESLMALPLRHPLCEKELRLRGRR